MGPDRVERIPTMTAAIDGLDAIHIQNATGPDGQVPCEPQASLVFRAWRINSPFDDPGETVPPHG